MKQALCAGVVSAAASVVFLLAILLFAGPAHARWKAAYAQAPAGVQAWYAQAELTKPASKRLGFSGCCKYSDVVHTRFRVDRTSGADEWYWLDRGIWRRIPADIIHWGEHAPGGKATLFVLANDFMNVRSEVMPAGTPTCFYPPESGN